MDEEEELKDDDHQCLLPLSDYEMVREERIKENKRKFDEISITTQKKLKRYKIINDYRICICVHTCIH